MAQRVTDVGIKMIKQWEGLKLYAYRNFQNEPWTIGHGHTSAAGIPNVREGMRINEVEAEEILKADLRKFEEDVSSLVKVPLTPHQFDALVSFAFNVGTGALHKSTLLKKLNAGDYDSVPGELMKWVKSKGKRMQGLVNRRSAEAGLWAKGSFVQSAGSPVDKQRASLLTPEATATATAFISSGALAYVPQTGPLAYALAGILVLACVAGISLYVWKRVKN